jgi:hypothetical protein
MRPIKLKSPIKNYFSNPPEYLEETNDQGKFFFWSRHGRGEIVQSDFLGPDQGIG